jgi:hypothetical protein
LIRSDPKAGPIDGTPAATAKTVGTAVRTNTSAVPCRFIAMPPDEGFAWAA